MKNKSFLHFILCATVAFSLLSCDKQNQNNPGGGGVTGSDTHTQTGCMYVGITGFNSELYHFTGNPNRRYEILNQYSLNQYTSFVHNLRTAKNTSLFWAVEDNLNHLKQCSFPSDISNISIVTFTDGLENGSGNFDAKFLDLADYDKNLDLLNTKIGNTSVQNVKLTAYTVGVKGNDVSNETRFDNTLVKLSSGAGYSNNVNMGSLNETFQGIANDLYKQNSKPNLTVAVPPQVRTERIIFDNKSAEQSKIYIEATKLKESPTTYSNIKYVGCKSESGTTVKGHKNSEGSVVFTFENFVDENGNNIQFSKTALYYYDGSGWAIDSEYDGEKGAKTEEIHKSAAVMLILDCSSSLDENNNFAKVQDAAINFLNVLASGANNPGGNPGGNDDNSKHCWKLSYTYEGTHVETYVWGTEAEIKAEVAEAYKEAGIVISYSLNTANSEDACESLNSTEPTEPEQGATMYIKHPWGGGAWTWQPMSEMTQEGLTVYYYKGIWGGTGFNINSEPSDVNAKWFPESYIAEIMGQDNLASYLGKNVTFVYYQYEGMDIAIIDEDSSHF